MTRLIILSAAGALAIGAVAFQRSSSAQPAAPATPAAAAGPKTINPPVLPPELPEGPGRETVLAQCTLCHSPRYITTQPRFSREVWTTEVDKMRKTYGAPIPEAQTEPIVNYLFATHGTGPAKQQQTQGGK